MEEQARSQLTPCLPSATMWNRRQTSAEQESQRKLTQLRQRKISTALKAESIERKLQQGHVEESYVGQLRSLQEELCRVDHSLRKLAQDVVERKRLQEVAYENRFGTLRKFRDKVQTRQLSVPEIIVTQSSCSVPSIPDSVNRELAAVVSPKSSRSKWLFKWPSLADISSGLLRPRSRSASCSKSYGRRHRQSCNFSMSDNCGRDEDEEVEHSDWVVPLPTHTTQLQHGLGILYTDEPMFYDDKQAAVLTDALLLTPQAEPGPGNTGTNGGNGSSARQSRDKASFLQTDRKAIDPTALAEIAAFEQLIENYFHANVRRRSFSLYA